VHDYVALVAELPLAVAPASLTGMIEHPALPVSRTLRSVADAKRRRRRDRFR
jgi:hypothetical protein